MGIQGARASWPPTLQQFSLQFGLGRAKVSSFSRSFVDAGDGVRRFGFQPTSALDPLEGAEQSPDAAPTEPMPHYITNKPLNQHQIPLTSS